MQLIPAKCTSCGGVLSVEEGKDAAICPYCGNAFIVEKAIQNFSATYIINNIHADTVIMNGGQKDFEISAGTLKKYRGENPEVIIPDNVDCIAEGAFAGLNIVSVVIPGSVERIEDSAFYGCKKLKSVELQKGIKRIGKRAFAYCTSLEKVSIPEGTQLGVSCFSACAGLKEFRMNSSNLSDIYAPGCFFQFDDKIPDMTADVYIDGNRLFAPTTLQTYFTGCKLKYKTERFSASTVLEAEQNACAYWNCDKYSIEYKVLQEPKGSVFGKKDAKIEATYIGN